MAKSSSSITGQVHEKLSHTCIHGHFHSLEDEQIIWTDKSFQTNKSSYAQTGQTNFSTKILSKSCLTFGRLERRFFRDDLPVEMNKSTRVRHKVTSDKQMLDNLYTCPDD